MQYFAWILVFLKYHWLILRRKTITLIELVLWPTISFFYIHQGNNESYNNNLRKSVFEKTSETFPNVFLLNAFQSPYLWPMNNKAYSLFGTKITCIVLKFRENQIEGTQKSESQDFDYAINFKSYSGTLKAHCLV